MTFFVGFPYFFSSGHAAVVAQRHTIRPWLRSAKSRGSQLSNNVICSRKYVVEGERAEVLQNRPAKHTRTIFRGARCFTPTHISSGFCALRIRYLLKAWGVGRSIVRESVLRESLPFLRYVRLKIGTFAHLSTSVSSAT